MAKGTHQRSTQKGVEIKNRVRGQPTTEGTDSLNHEQARIRKWLKQIRFKKAFFGGVKEADVWKKIAELNTMYEAALSAERARYDALLKAQTEQLPRQAAEQITMEENLSAEHRKAGDGAYG